MFAEIGRLTQDVSLTPIGDDGKCVVNNRLAISYDKDRTAYIDLSAWNRTGQFMADHFKKGDELFVEGELRNKTNMIAGKEITMPYLLVTRVRFTHGNNRE